MRIECVRSHRSRTLGLPKAGGAIARRPLHCLIKRCISLQSTVLPRLATVKSEMSVFVPFSATPGIFNRQAKG